MNLVPREASYLRQLLGHDGGTVIAGAFAPDHVEIDVDLDQPRDILRVAADAMCRSPVLDDRLILDALCRREQAAPTCIGHGVAIPHARVAGLAHAVTLYMRLRRGVDFGASDGTAVRHLLVILVPRDGHDDEHLRLLAGVARLFSSDRFRRCIDAAPTVDEVRHAFARGA